MIENDVIFIDGQYIDVLDNELHIDEPISMRVFFFLFFAFHLIFFCEGHSREREREKNDIAWNFKFLLNRVATGSNHITPVIMQLLSL